MFCTRATVVGCVHLMRLTYPAAIADLADLAPVDRVAKYNPGAAFVALLLSTLIRLPTKLVT